MSDSEDSYSDEGEVVAATDGRGFLERLGCGGPWGSSSDAPKVYEEEDSGEDQDDGDDDDDGEKCSSDDDEDGVGVVIKPLGKLKVRTDGLEKSTEGMETDREPLPWGGRKSGEHFPFRTNGLGLEEQELDMKQTSGCFVCAKGN